MTSKHHILKAIDHIETARVPLTFDADDAVYKMLYDHLQISTKENLFDRLHVDTWMLLPGNFIYPSDQDNRLEKTSIWGYKVDVMSYASGTYDALSFSPLEGKDNISDIKAHPWPSPNILDFSHYTKEAKDHEDRAIIGVFTWGAFFIACYVRGMESLMMDFALRRDYVDHLLKRINEISAQSLKTMLSKYGDGIDIVFMCDDYCSQLGPLFSPADFKKFVLPYLKELVDITHQYNKKFLLHVCGSVRQLLPMIIEAGVDLLEPIQTKAAGMDPEGLKKDFGKDICFYGGVDLQELLPNATPQKVAEEVNRLIDVLGSGGGYILGPGHTYIQADTPIENILTMYETAFNYRFGDR